MPEVRSAAVAEQLRKAVDSYRAGQFGLAESHGRRVVKLAPDHAEAWHLLGRVAFARGNPVLAIRHYRKALEIRPDWPPVLDDLAQAYRERGETAAALAACRHALALHPGYAEAALTLGTLLEMQDNPAQAEAAYRQAIARHPGPVEVLLKLAALLQRQRRTDEALRLLEQACATAPESTDVLIRLGTLRIESGQYAVARRLAEAIILREPGKPDGWRIAGVAARLEHDLYSAIPALRRALELAPSDVAAQAELALALGEAGEYEEAGALFAEVAWRWPGNERIRWLAELVLPAVYADEAAVDAARSRFAAGLARLEAGLRLDDATRREAAYQAAVAVTPFHLHYQPRDNTALQCRFGDLVWRVMQAVAPTFGAPLPWRALAHGGRIRVGFVSSHLAQHSVTRYFGRLLTGLDAQRFEVFVWHTGTRRDAVTARIAAAVAHFEEVFEQPDIVAARIHQARLDVLVYLDVGMDPAQQTLAALRLAPVQCTAYGHPVTSGSAEIDYFLSGAALEPAAADAQYRETLVRLPGIGTQPERPPAPGDGAWLDALRGERPLLLCLQNLIKLVPAFDTLLARVLRATGARVGFFDRATALAGRYRQRLAPVLAAHGIDAERDAVFIPARAHTDYLGGISRADLILDTPWFSGGATSLDALSVGMPIVALEGAMLRGRQTAAMLRLAGAPELIAADEDAYVDLAAGLCRDAARRRALRARLIAGSAAIFDDPAPIHAFAGFLAFAATRAAAGQKPGPWPLPEEG